MQCPNCRYAAVAYTRTPPNCRPGIDGRRNEPGYLPWITAALAELRGETAEQLAAATEANARRFFRLQDAGGIA